MCNMERSRNSEKENREENVCLNMVCKHLGTDLAQNVNEVSSMK